MAELKTDKILLPTEFQIALDDGWMLDIDVNTVPAKYTLTHGKKSMSFNRDVTMNLCSRNYGIRLVKGRRQMVLPPHVLQSFVDYSTFLTWYDHPDGHVTPEPYKSAHLDDQCIS